MENQFNYTEQKIAETLETNYMPYAMSVIVSRAILPCVINCKDGGATLEAAYKFKGTSFTVSQFVPGKLVD